MKHKVRWLWLIAGLLLLVIASVISSLSVGMEASAAAKQVTTGYDYLQARAEMQLWPTVTRLTAVIGAILLVVGIIRSLIPVKPTA